MNKAVFRDPGIELQRSIIPGLRKWSRIGTSIQSVFILYLFVSLYIFLTVTLNKLTDLITGASHGGAVRPPPRSQSGPAARAQVLAPPAHHLAHAHARPLPTGQAAQGQTQARFYLDRRLQGVQHFYHHQHDPLRPQILI